MNCSIKLIYIYTLFAFPHLLKKKKKKRQKRSSTDLELEVALTKVEFEYSLNFLQKIELNKFILPYVKRGEKAHINSPKHHAFFVITISSISKNLEMKITIIQYQSKSKNT
jgi:hypothetical protein